LLWGALYLSLALLLYAPVLGAFPVFDDISILLMSQRPFLACWEPMGNGFWRPLGLSAAWVLARAFDGAPLAFHLFPVVLHAANAALFRRAALGMGWSNATATAAGGFFVAHFAAFPAVSAMQYSMDVLLGTATLLAIMAARWRAGGFPLAPLAAIFAFGIMSKETACVLPFAAAARWLSTAPRGERRNAAALRSIAVLCVLGALSAATIALLQATCADSYARIGMLRASPIDVAAKLLQYLYSAAFPYVHVARMPWDFVVLSGTSPWVATLGAAMLATAACLDRRRARWLEPAGLLACAAMLVALPAVASAGHGGRFVYSAIAPVLLALGEVVRRLGSVRIRRSAWVAACLSTILSITSFFASPTVTEYCRFAQDIENFVADCRAEAPSWPRGCHISIYGTPHPGDGPYRWVYCQMLFLVFIPETDATVVLDQVTDRTARTYRFHAGYLREFDPPPEPPQ